MKEKTSEFSRAQETCDAETKRGLEAQGKKKASKDAARRFFQPEIKAQEQSSSSDMKKNVLFLG